MKTKQKRIVGLVSFLAASNASAVYRRESCLSVCLSVCPSVKGVHCDKTEERSVQIFILHERLFILVFWEEEWLVGATPSTWNFRSSWPRWSEIADFQSIFARSASAVAPSKKFMEVHCALSSEPKPPRHTPNVK